MEQSLETRALVVEECDTHAVVRLDNPAERNCLSVATVVELDAVISALVARANLLTIILTGTGDAFASGANIRELRALTSETAREFAFRGQRLMQRIVDSPQLTIAAVNGYCMGGGLDLALACDVRCASPSAVFAHPGARLGIITGWGGTQRLTRLIGQSRALEMFTTARRVTATEAFEIGLVNRVAEPVLACALTLAQAAYA